MEPLSVVLFHRDARVAENLAASLSRHFHPIHVARTSSEVRSALTRLRADVLVLDLEASGLKDVQVLHREFPDLSIVCTHRLADEELWAEALRAGAADMCEPWHTDDALQSISRERHRAVA